MKCVSNMLTGNLYKKMRRAQGMRNLVFDIKEVIDKPTDLDVWVVYQTEKELDMYHSLKLLLWDVQFDPKKVVKNYHLKHHTFYHILS